MYNRKALKYYEQGLQFQRQGKFLSAERCYKKALKIEKNFYEAYGNLGNTYQSRGKFQQAKHAFRKALIISPSNKILINNLGNILALQGDNEKAIKYFKRAINIDSDYADPYSNLGNALAGLDQLEEAVDAYHIAIEKSPVHEAAYIGLGAAQRRLMNLQDASKAYHKAIEIRPESSQAYNGLGNIYLEQGRLEDAIRAYRKTISINKYFTEAYNGLSAVLHEKGKTAEAIRCLKEALGIDREYVSTHWNLAIYLLSQGVFSKGWIEYEWRKQKKKDIREVHSLLPKWDGKGLSEKTILVTAEQGIGDEVMFSSCLEDLINKGPKRVILECAPRLESVFRRSFPSIQVEGRKRDDISWLSSYPEIDVQVAIDSLPRFFRNSLNDFATGYSWIVARSDLVTKWRKRFNSFGDRPIIGVAWRSILGTYDSRNFPKLSELSPLFCIDGIEFVNMQYEVQEKELEEINSRFGVTLRTWHDVDLKNDIEEVMAMLSAMDVLVSWHTSVTDFAGALGVKAVSVIPRYNQNVRMLGSGGYPWASSVRVVEQKTRMEFDGVFEAVVEEVSDILKEKGV